MKNILSPEECYLIAHLEAPFGGGKPDKYDIKAIHMYADQFKKSGSSGVDEENETNARLIEALQSAITFVKHSVPQHSIVSEHVARWQRVVDKALSLNN